MYVRDRVGGVDILIEAADAPASACLDGNVPGIGTGRRTVPTSAALMPDSKIAEAQVLVGNIATGFDSQLRELPAGIGEFEVELSLTLSAELRTWIVSAGSSLRRATAWRGLRAICG